MSCRPTPISSERSSRPSVESHGVKFRASSGHASLTRTFSNFPNGTLVKSDMMLLSHTREKAPVECQRIPYGCRFKLLVVEEEDGSGDGCGPAAVLIAHGRLGDVGEIGRASCNTRG